MSQKSAKVNRSARCMARFKQLLDQYQPSVLVLEKYGAENSRRGERIRVLAQTMRGFANNRDMDTLAYSREEVSVTVADNEKATRHAVALAVAEQLPILRTGSPQRLHRKKSPRDVSSMSPARTG